MERKNFNEIHNNALNGWGVSFRRSQIFRYKKFIKILKNHNITDDVLEIGCSSGFFTSKYLYPLYGENILACDTSNVAILKAKDKYPFIHFEINSLPDLNYELERFGLVIAAEVLYYLSTDEQEKSIDNIFKILRRNGYLLVSVNIGSKPYFTEKEIVSLISKRFEIVSTDTLFLKSYYKYLETKLYSFIRRISNNESFQIRPFDKSSKIIFKKILNKNLFRNLIILILKILLYSMPIMFIDFISKKINQEREMSVFIILAKKN